MSIAKAEQRRVKVLRVNADGILRLLTSGEWIRSVEKFPADLRMVGTYYDVLIDEYQIAVESASFPEVPNGNTAPSVALRFEAAPPSRRNF